MFKFVFSALYTIEFQKRGLPHARAFFNRESKLLTGDQFDKIISVDIPDKDMHPYLYEVVGDMMVHGRCGVENPKNVCLQDGRYTKYFPKPYSPITKIDEAWFPIYRGRDDKRVI